MNDHDGVIRGYNMDKLCVTCGFCKPKNVDRGIDYCGRVTNPCKIERQRRGIIFGRNRCGPDARYYKLLLESNMETRRKLIEKIGMDNFLKDINASVMDTYKGYILYTYDDEESPDKEVHVLKMVCPSTERVYFGYVPPYIRTAKQAVAWRFWLTEVDYELVEET